MQTKQLSLLQNKRENGYFDLRIKNNFIIQKEISFSVSNSNKKIEIIKQKNESGNGINEQQNLINNEVKSWQKFFDESLDNSKSKGNNKIQNITDDMKVHLINNNSINNNPFSKINYFKVTKDLNNKYLLDSNSNNEIKVLKNNKAIYINRYLLKSYSTSRALKKLKKIKFVIRNKRSSKYRGVSKNGSKWQVLIMINNKKCYIGSYFSEDTAARIYDIFSIKNRGIKARTNFKYNNIQIKKIIENKININSDNISEVIEDLIK